MKIGIKGILVKTGKYIDGIERNYEMKPTRIVDTFAHAVDLLVEANFQI